MASIRNLFTGMPPMLDALAQQTDVKLPSFFPQAGLNCMSGQPGSMFNAIAGVKQQPVILLCSRTHHIY